MRTGGRDTEGKERREGRCNGRTKGGGMKKGGGRQIVKEVQQQ